METASRDTWIDPNAHCCRKIAVSCFEALSRDAPAAEMQTRHFSLPGIDLKVESVGAKASALLTAAFSHLERSSPSEDGQPILWRIGDSSFCGDFPEFPLPISILPGAGVFNTSSDGNLFVERRNKMVSVYDHRSHIITTICQGVEHLENDVIAKPLLRFLLGILAQQDIYLAHAALVGLNGRGLLVTGKGGMGKSTISSAALGSGMSFCADDFVALQRKGDAIIGHSLYATLLLFPDQLPLHPHFEMHSRPSRSVEIPKSVVILGKDFQDQTVPRLNVDAISVPQVTQLQESELQPMSRIAALRALAPTSVFSSPWREVSRAKFLMSLAVDLPCFTYLSGSDFQKSLIP